MGHSDRGSTSIPAENVHPYLTFKSHSSGVNNQTELVMMEAFRKAHPDAYITAISGQHADFFGWAGAGNAQLTALEQDDNLSLRRQKYDLPSEKSHGTTAPFDHDVFGHYRLVYDTWDMYVVEWAWNVMGYRMRLFYVVAPKAQSSLVNDMFLRIAEWTSRLHDEVYVFDNGEWTKNQQLWGAVRASSWNDVMLDPAIKQPLYQDVLRFFSSKAVYARYGVPWKRGLIFHGPPGNGKTMAIRSLMNALTEDDISCLVVKTFRSCKEPETSIESVFEHARDLAPCLLVFEDLDSLVTDSMRSYFLNQIDGLESNDGILIIASTNHVDRLDSSISRRPSRFDKKYHFQLPDRPARIRYCEHWSVKLQQNDDIDFTPETAELVADLTEDFSFAYLKELLVQSLFAVLRDEADHMDSGENIRKMLITANVPGIEIPDALLSIPFTRIICKQAIILREDMEVTGQ